MVGSTPFATPVAAALYWAERGFPVFPWHLRDGQKIPCIKAWEQCATCDPQEINRLWGRFPKSGVGSPPHRSGHFVLDVDNKGDKCGDLSLLQLEAEHAPLPETMETITRSGGRHLWFKGEALNSVSRLGPGLDIRGKGGWAAMPGSSGYSLNPLHQEVASPPKWLQAALTNLSQEHEPRQAAINEDLPVNLDVIRRRLADLVARGDVAVEGQGGNDRTYRLAQELQDLGASPEASLSLLEEHWNPYCAPPWDREELERIVDNATRYRQNEGGVKAADDGGAVFAGIAVSSATPAEAPSPKRPRFLPLSEADQDALPEPAWLVPGWLQHCSTALLYGRPGSMKSFAMLDCALSVASGLPAWGIEPSSARYPVVYIAPEGAIGIAKQRRKAWRAARGIVGPLPFYLIREAPLVREPAHFPELMAAIEAKCLPRLIVIDTVSRIMAGLAENDTQDATRAIELADGLSRRYSCTVVLVHHTPKNGTGPRGSGVFEADVSALFSCEYAKSSRIVTLSCPKQKDAEEPAPIRFKVRAEGASIVLDRTEEFPQDDAADSQLAGDVALCLAEMGAVSEGRGVTTAALAEHLCHFRGYVGADLRATWSKQISTFGRSEGAGYKIPGTSPTLWSLPS